MAFRGSGYRTRYIVRVVGFQMEKKMEKDEETWLPGYLYVYMYISICTYM